jgi:outer membrane protein assembly factor BamE (lipoprotein component of BamABCDE complex)
MSAPSDSVAGLRRLLPVFFALGLSAACVTEDTTTGELVPRGDQKYTFERVEKAAERLAVGMTKTEASLLLGSPAETSESGDVWVYLPERYGILIPTKALRLEFHEQVLAEYGFQAIVLGARL